MTKKSIFLLFFILILLSSFCYAVKPTQVSTQTAALQIVYPEFDFYKLGSQLTLNFHVYNSTGAWLTNSTAGCVIHVYNNNGTHLYIANLTYDAADKDFKYILNITNITASTTLAYLVYCNTTTESGFVGNGFRLNYNARDPSLNTNYLPVVIFLIGICFILITISNNLDPRHGILKLILLSFVVLFFIVFGVVLLTMFRGGALDIHALLFFKTNTWLLRIFFSYVLIFLLIMVFEKLGMLVKVKSFFKVK